MVIQTNLKCELQKAVRVQYLNGNLFSQDNQGNQINVEVFDGGSPASLSGSVSANVIRADGGTVAVSSGTVSGNVASVTLPSAAYAVPGVVSIIIKITSSGVITTLAAIVANVYQSSTDTAVDPGTIIPSIQTLISSIETAVASIPADYSSLWTSLAPAFNSSNNYAAGQYVTHNGTVYMFKNDHSGSWSASDVVAVDIGGQISQLKNAFDINDTATKSMQEYLGEGVVYKNKTAHGSAISIEMSELPVHAEVGWNVKVKIVDEANTSKSFVLYTKYAEDDSASNIATVAQGIEYSFVSQKTLEYVSVYQTGLTGGNTIITAIVTNPDGFEQKEPVIESDILALQKETGIVKTVKKSVTHTTSVYAEDSITNIYAEQGWEVSVKVDDSANDEFGYTIYVKYKEDENRTSLGFVGVEGITYKFTSSKTLEYIAIYATSLSSGTATITVSVYNPNGVFQDVEGKVDKNGIKEVTTDNLADVTSNILYKKDQEVVSGTGSYVNKVIYTFDGPFKAGDKFNILADSVTGASAPAPYAIYLKNSNDANIRQRQYADVEITQTDINNGLDHIDFILYPAKGTAMSSGSATYTNVRIIKGDEETCSLTGQLLQAVKEIVGDDAGIVPEYYFEDDYLATKAARINQLAEQCAGNGDVFVFITDEHYDFGYNQKHSPSIIEHLCTKCQLPRLFDGGDTANGGSIEWINMIRSGFNHRIHHVMGNHEWMLDRSGDYLAYYFDSFAYNQIGDADKHYYYVDNDQKKIRYIILNAWKSDLEHSNTIVTAYGNDQLTWFTETALNVESGWGIIIFTHFIKAGTNIAPDGALNFLNAIDNYSGNGEIICIFEGHTHYDSISHTTGGIPIINTTCDKNKSWINDGVNMEPWLDAQRPDGTIYEQAFDVVCVNRSIKKINAVRIGALAMNNVDKTFGNNDFTTDGTLEEREVSYGTT